MLPGRGRPLGEGPEGSPRFVRERMLVVIYRGEGFRYLFRPSRVVTSQEGLRRETRGDDTVTGPPYYGPKVPYRTKLSHGKESRSLSHPLPDTGTVTDRDGKEGGWSEGLRGLCPAGCSGEVVSVLSRSDCGRAEQPGPFHPTHRHQGDVGGRWSGRIRLSTGGSSTTEARTAGLLWEPRKGMGRRVTDGVRRATGLRRVVQTRSRSPGALVTVLLSREEVVILRSK